MIPQIPGRAEPLPLTDQVAGEEMRRTLPRCGGCESVCYPADSYCPNCGLRLPDHCLICGAPVEHPVANFCTACGHGLGTPPDGDRTS